MAQSIGAQSDKLLIVSLDGHACCPPKAWPEYLEQRFHKYIPRLTEENAMYTATTGGFSERTHAPSRYPDFDLDDAYKNGGFKGLYDNTIRLQELDREGIAAEAITNGDPRLSGLMFQSSNTVYPLDAAQAGLKAYHRWLKDEFGASGRFLLVGTAGCAPWRSMDEMVAELDWCADNGFIASNMPTFTTYMTQPALFERYWDPYWARCEELGLPIWMHAAFGERQGELGGEIIKIYKRVQAAKGTPDELKSKVNTDVFANGAIFSSAKPRRAMWQMMMGGVFDRFPKLKLVIAEIYGDWMPATLSYLDQQFELHRDRLPAKKKPSEYWAEHGLNCLSFARQCDLDARHVIGLKNTAFGRDYPHTEGTWPNTKDFMRTVFKGFPPEEVKDILGENAIRFLKLDRTKLTAIAEKIGAPTLNDILGPGPALSPKLIEHLDQRAHIYTPSEGATRIPEMDEMMQEDLWRVGAIA